MHVHRDQTHKTGVGILPCCILSGAADDLQSRLSGFASLSLRSIELRSARLSAHAYRVIAKNGHPASSQFNAFWRTENHAVGKIAGPSMTSLPPDSIVLGTPAGIRNANFFTPAAP